jgi:hypothetical protein
LLLPATVLGLKEPPNKYMEEPFPLTAAEPAPLALMFAVPDIITTPPFEQPIAGVLERVLDTVPPLISICPLRTAL